MDKLIKYLKSLNPKPDQQCILIYNRYYHLWREGKYLGIAQWRQDENVGDSFQTDDENGLTHVYVADKWELMIKSK